MPLLLRPILVRWIPILALLCGTLLSGAQAGRGAPATPQYGGTDADVVVPDGAYPAVTQNNSTIWSNGTTTVAVYDDSRNAPNCYGGLAWSGDNGATWHPTSALCSGAGVNQGSQAVVYNNRLMTWYAIGLATRTTGAGCSTGSNAAGIASWTSVNGQTWNAAGCVHYAQLSRDSSPALWVDNEPSSLYYGRMYVVFDRSGTVQVCYSDDGTTWQQPTTLAQGSGPELQVTGSPNGDGAVFVLLSNYLFRSTNGGASWSVTSVNSYTPAGDPSAACPNVARVVSPDWTSPEAGQLAVGPQIGGQNTLLWVYAAHGAGADQGDIYAVRSTDNGSTWGAPVQLNGDGTTTAQWQPSVAITARGGVAVSWYDRLNVSTGDGYEVWGRVSTDGGATWQAEQAISDGVIAPPTQPDPNVPACGSGDHRFAFALGDTVYNTWVDGRGLVQGIHTQDVEADRLDPCPANPGAYRVLVLYADLNTPPTTLRDQLLAEPGIAAVDLLDGQANAPSLALLQSYDIVVPFSNSNWNDPLTLGDNLAAYLQGGGIVVAFSFDWHGAARTIQGNWINGGYSPFVSPGTSNFTSDTLGAHSPAHPLLLGISALGASYRDSLTLASGATLAAGWTDGTPLIATKGRAVGVSAYVGDYLAGWSGAYSRLIANAGRWLQPPACAATNPTITPTRTISPTATRTGTITPTPAVSPTRTATGTATRTASATATGTATPNATATGSLPTATATGSLPTITTTPPRTTTPTLTSTASATAATQTALPATATSTATGVAATATGTSLSATATQTPTAGPPTASATATLCPISFTDVQPSDYFYEPVISLACHGVIGGYGDGSFRPYNNTTRGQLTKIVVLGFALPLDSSGGPHFTDVPVGSTFYSYVETAANRGILGGYSDGTFRPGNQVTRGQLSKIVVGAAGWPLLHAATPSFSDVPLGSPFYDYVETAACHGVVGGYSDGTFRPAANATRGQISKIVYLALRSGPAVCFVTH